MDQQLINSLADAAFIIFVAVVGFLAKIIVAWLKKEGVIAELESKQEYARIVVQAAQQMYKEAGGPDKFESAKQNLIVFLQKKKIPIDEDELSLLIESAVKSMKDGVVEGLNKDGEK